MDLFNLENLIKEADENAKKLVKFDLKSNQIRNFFGSVIKIKQMYDKEKIYSDEINSQIILLKPKLAYAAGRQNDVKPFKIFVEDAINSLLLVENTKKAKALENFFALIESIIAYHKFHKN